MKFFVKDTLSDEEIERGLKSVIRDSLTSQVMNTLSGGVFLVAFAMKLGASNTTIGPLASIPPLAQLVQIPYKMFLCFFIFASFRYRVATPILSIFAASSRFPFVTSKTF